jgi:hypothetical protein
MGANTFENRGKGKTAEEAQKEAVEMTRDILTNALETLP